VKNKVFGVKLVYFSIKTLNNGIMQKRKVYNMGINVQKRLNIIVLAKQL